VDDRAVAEIALIENMQRKDLTAWEEADGLAALCERFGYTHEDVARKVGKSRTTVTEALSIASLPEVIREKCRRADIGAKSLLLQIVRQPHVEAMHDILEEITTQGLNRDGARAARRSKQEAKKSQPGTQRNPAPYIYKYTAEDGEFTLEARFRRSDVAPQQIAVALTKVLYSLEGGAETAESE